MLHQLRDEVEFGIDGQLVVRFPLPRLHQISRQFTVECYSRAPARLPVITVSQKHGNFREFTRAYGRRLMERVGCPKIVNLRYMQSQGLVKRLHINLYADNATKGAEERLTTLSDSMGIRLAWIKSFVQDIRSLGIRFRVHVRFMLNDARDIHTFSRIPNVSSMMRRGDAFDVVVDCPSEQEYHKEEFSRAKILAMWRRKSDLRYDHQEIRRCETLADLRSNWSTAAPSPKSSQGEEIGDYQELV